MKQGWEIKKLGEITTSINGLWTGKKPPFITIAVIRNTNFTKDCKLDTSDIAYIDVEVKQYASRKLQCGDIIIEKSGGSDKQPVGRPILFNIEEGEYSFSNFTSTLRVRDKTTILPEFIHRYLAYIYMRGDTAAMQSKTTGIRNLDFNLYKSINTPVPPREEQERIVEELDCLSGVIENKREQLKQLDALAQSIFYQMFGDPIINEKGWEVKKMGEIVQSNMIGLTRSGAEQGESKQYLYFKMNNISNKGGVDFSKLTRVDASNSEIEKYSLSYGDFLFNTRNSFDLVGKSCVYNVRYGEIMVFNNNIMRIVFNQNVSTIYMAYLFQNRYISEQLDKIKKGTTSVWAIYYKDLEHILVNIPPFALQQEFANKIEAIEKQKELIKKSITQTEELFNSRMDYYFN